MRPNAANQVIPYHLIERGPMLKTIGSISGIINLISKKATIDETLLQIDFSTIGLRYRDDRFLIWVEE